MKDATPDFQQVANRAWFFQPQKHVDTVVFIHGLSGDCRSTWKKFPALLASDPDLPDIDILLWGYESSFFLPTVHDVATEGQHLVTALEITLNDTNSIHLVGHSMGGLVIFEALLRELKGNRANRHPASQISYISLFATPVNGSAACRIIENTPIAGWVANKHVQSLAQGDRFDAVLDDVTTRIFNPSENTDSTRCIPIRMIMATLDRAVTEADRNSALARFAGVMPRQLNYDHRGIKAPNSHLDERYGALTKDLQQGFALRFHQICRCMLSPNAGVKDTAMLEFRCRYENILLSRFIQAGYNPELDIKKCAQLVRIVVNEGAKTAQPVFIIVNRAMIALSSKLSMG